MSNDGCMQGMTLFDVTHNFFAANIYRGIFHLTKDSSVIQYNTSNTHTHTFYYFGSFRFIHFISLVSVFVLLYFHLTTFKNTFRLNYKMIASV